MGFSSPEVSCEVCELTRLWMLCRVDQRCLVRLSGLGSRSTHPRRSPSSARSWSSTLPIWERQSWLLQDKCLAVFYLPPTQIACLFSKASTVHIIISMCYYYNYACYCNYAHYCMFFCKGWLESIGSRVVYELDYKKPILYVIPIQSILGKLPVVPVGDTGTIPYHLRNTFSGAPGDRRLGAGNGCKMWFVNSWALGWSRDM